jgi:hypothetical protein
MEVPTVAPVLQAPGLLTTMGAPTIAHVPQVSGPLTAKLSTANTLKKRVLVDEDVEAVDRDQERDSTCSSQGSSRRRGRRSRKRRRRRMSTESSSQEYSPPRNFPPPSPPLTRGWPSGPFPPPPPPQGWGPQDLGRKFRKQIHCVIYRVDCKDRRSSELTKLYLDAPKREYGVYSDHYHLMGSVEVLDLGPFISSAGSLAYLVFRDVNCDNNLRWDKAQGSSLSSGSKMFWKESIAIIDDGLRSCVDSVAQCAFNESAYHPVSPQIYYPQMDQKNRDLYELRFFYHHREALGSGLHSFASPLKEQVQGLLDFLQETHGTEYSETDQLLSQGLIHRDQLEMLFCPNSIVLSRQAGSLSAFVLRSWPSGTSALTLDCWYWGFDGQWLHRKSVTKRVLRPLKNVVRIRDLEVFPLQFATEEEKTTLECRGQKFWSLRHQSLASYDGWDFKGEQHYVSHNFRISR